jgi:hypothetical protein
MAVIGAAKAFLPYQPAGVRPAGEQGPSRVTPGPAARAASPKPPGPPPARANGDPGSEMRARPYRSVIAALLMTGAPRSLLADASRSWLPSRQIDVTIVSPGKNTPRKRAW